VSDVTETVIELQAQFRRGGAWSTIEEWPAPPGRPDALAGLLALAEDTAEVYAKTRRKARYRVRHVQRRVTWESPENAWE
jgi:hypothetical protein